MKRNFLSFMLIVLLMFSSTIAVFADTLKADTLAVGNSNVVNLGEYSPGQKISTQVYIYANGKGEYGISGALVTAWGNELSATSVTLFTSGDKNGQTSYVTGIAPSSFGDFSYNVTWSTNHGEFTGQGNKSVEVTFKGTVLASADTTPPVVIAHTDPPPNAEGWHNRDVNVTFEATDDSGSVELFEPNPNPFTVSEEGVHTFTGYARDAAGNVGSSSITIRLDKTPPTIEGEVDRPPNAAGWYNDEVQVTYIANDVLSGIDSVTDPVTLSSEGVDQSVIGTATDKAGNSSSTKVSGINIDKTAPIITVEKLTYVLNEVANWSAFDELSGVATTIGFIDTSSVGTKTVTLTATDNAGNEVTETIEYKVEYNFGGILPPIKNKSVFKAGSTIPVKFQLTDATGAYVTDAEAKIYVKKWSNDVNEENPVLSGVSSSAATTGNLFRYDYTSNEYIFNLSTKNYNAGSYEVTIILNEGSSQSVIIGLK